MDPLADATSLATLPAATSGPIDAGAFSIFEPFYEAVLGGIGDVMNNGTATMIGYVHDFFVPICTLAVILMALVEAFGMGTYLFWLAKYLIRAGITLTFIDTAGDYTKWVITPIRHMGDDISAALNGVQAGAPGHINDVLMAHYSAAVVQTIERLPWSSVTGALESIVPAGAAGASWLIAFFADGVYFAVGLFIDIYLVAVLIVGVLFVALSMAGPLRNWLMGWLNSIASLVLSKIFLGIGMTILTRAIDQILQSVLNIADNANVWSSIGHLFGGMIALCIGAVYALTVRGMAVGIVGGIYAAMQPYASAARGALATAMAATASSSSGATSSVATPAMAIPRAAP